ncbi:MAG TPA: hypothetical protein V6C76_00890 [Drouetiella sp.]
MTSSWNNFSIGKVDPKESTTEHTEQHPATTTPQSTLNLANLTKPEVAPTLAPAEPKPAPGSGNALDFGVGVAHGIGTQAIGTLSALYQNNDQSQIQEALRRGGSGQGAAGMGVGDVAKRLYDGVSNTVSLVWNNPSAVTAIPGQIAQNFSQGDWKTRGDIIGQASFLVGSLYVGGAGVSKAGSVARDVREASSVAKGMSTLTEAGTTMRSLETTVAGLANESSAMSRVSTVIGDGAGLARTGSAILGDTRAVTAEASGLLRTGSFADRVLPATEGATKFLVKSETASSVGVSELSLPNRLLGLQTTESNAGVFSKFMSRFKPTTEVESLAGKVQPLQKFTRTGESAASEVGTLTTGAQKVEGLAGTTSRVGALTGDATRVDNLVNGASRVEGLAPKVDNLINGVSHVEGVAPKVDGLLTGTSRVEGLAPKVEGLVTGTPHVEGLASRLESVVGRTEGVVPKLEGAVEGVVPKLEGAVQKVEGVGPRVETVLGRTEGVVERTEGVAGQVARETPVAVSEAERLANLSKQVDTAPGAALTAGRELPGIARAGENVVRNATENAATAERITTQVRTATSEIAEHTSTLTAQTSELATRFGGNPAVRELEAATKQMTQATSAADKSQALVAIEKATAKVAADLPAEATAGLRSTVEALKSPVQVVARSEAVEVAVTQIAERSTTLSKQVESLTATSTTPAMQELSTATRQLSEAKTVAQKAEAFTAVERATAKVATEVPAETAAALRNTVESLRTPVQAATRAEAFESAAVQVADHSASLTSQTTQLTTKFGANPAVQELSTATRQFNEAATYAEKAQALSAVERASVKVANEVPEAGAALKQTVDSLKAPVETAVRAERAEMVATQIAERSNKLAADTANLTAKLGENPAVRELSAATKEFTEASGAVEKAQAFARVEKAADAVKTLSPEGAQVARTVESLGAPVETAARAQRLERAVTAVDESATTLSSQTKALVQELKAADGTVPASVRELDSAASRFGSAATNAERAQALEAVQKSAARVSEEFPGKATQVSETLKTIAPRIENAERIAQVENVAARVASRVDDVAHDASALKGTAPKAEAALSEIENSANAFSKSTNAAERAEHLSSMNKSFSAVQAEVGEAKAAGLKTSIARLENEAGTMDRVAAVDKSVNAVSTQSQTLARQAAELEAGTTNVAAKSALQNIQRAADEVGSGNVLNRSEQLALRAKDISTVETQLGTAAGAQMRTAIADLDRATAAARHQALDLVEYQGSKIAQQMGYLQDGALGTRTQAARLEQLSHDLTVMKSVVPGDSPITPILGRLEQQMHGVDAVSNILAHPEVARAPYKELLKLAQSTDAATATAAADRLILRGGKLGEFGDGPVAGLLSERAQFWNSQKQLVQLEDVYKAKLFESGRLFGVPTSDPLFRKTLADLAWTTGGLLLLEGTARYNLTQLTAMARDNVLSAQQAAESKEQTKKEQQQAQKSEQQAVAATAAAVAAEARANAEAFSGKTGSDSTGVSNQATFKNDSTTAAVSPAVQVYGTPKVTTNTEAVLLNLQKKKEWEAQYGGSVFHQVRGPGAPSVVQDDVRPTAAITPRARGMSVTPEADLTKIASTRFPLPRVLDISNQSSLLNSGTNQFSSKIGRPGSMAGNGGPARTWTTVDWSQVGGSHRTTASEGGKANKDLTKLEKDEEVGIDGAGGGSGGTANPNTNTVVAQTANDPSATDPNTVVASADPSTVVASNAQTQSQDDQNLAKI